MTIRALLASPHRDVEAALLALERSHRVVLLGAVESRPALMLHATRGDVDVVVLDEGFGEEPALGTARDLVAEVPEVGLVLLAREPSRAVLSAALHAGIRAVSVLPVDPDDLSRALSEAAAWSRVVRPRLSTGLGTSGLGQLVALAGAKGGVGTTTLAVHLATAAVTTTPQRRSCLVDLDLASGDVRSLLGLPGRRDLGMLLDPSGDPPALEIEDQLTLHRSGLRVLLAPAEGDRADAVSPELVRRVLGHLRGRFDLTLVDTGTGTAPVQSAAVSMADQVLLVLTPDMPAVRSARRVLDRWDRQGVRPDGVTAVLNRAIRDPDLPIDLIRRAVDAPLLNTTIPSDFAALKAATNTGLVERLAEGPVRAAFAQLAEELGLLPQKRRSRRSVRPSAAPVALGAGRGHLEDGVRAPYERSGR